MVLQFLCVLFLCTWTLLFQEQQLLREGRASSFWLERGLRMGPHWGEQVALKQYEATTGHSAVMSTYGILVIFR